MLSNMRYHTSVIISLFGAMGTLGTSSRKLMKLGAYAERISEMEAAMRDIRAGRGTGACGGAGAQGAGGMGSRASHGWLLGGVPWHSTG